MAENYTVRPFGLNVIPNTKDGRGADITAKQVEKSVEKAIGSLWEPVLSYLKENENVFSGDVSDQIGKINIQTMTLGMAMNRENPVRNLDTQF